MSIHSNLFATIKSYLWILVASAIFALGFDWCFAPNQISLGGITGLGQIINAAIPAIPIGTAVILLNVPLFLLGWKFLGGKVLVSSLFAMAASSAGVDLLASFYTFQPMDPMLASVFGGVLIGLSLGIVFSQRATTGGTDLIARLLKLWLGHLPMGKLLMAVDLVVIAAVALAFKSLHSALYGLIALYLTTVVMDRVLYGMDTAKVAYIITDHTQPVLNALVHQLDRGVTILHGQGAWSGEDKQVLMCAFKQRQIVALKQAVKELDPDAFLIVCDAHEVLGRGFRRYRQNDI
ncbi:MAG: YitT family protein [Lawsonibacter sp.]|jgi:uncharacterized membrane-anchored protein YitT (DUF2179 family)